MRSWVYLHHVAMNRSYFADANQRYNLEAPGAQADRAEAAKRQRLRWVPPFRDDGWASVQTAKNLPAPGDAPDGDRRALWQ